MFTNFLPTTEKLFQVQYADYAKKHFLKNFEKKYPGVQWEAKDDLPKNQNETVLMRCGLALVGLIKNPAI